MIWRRRGFSSSAADRLAPRNRTTRIQQLLRQYGGAFPDDSCSCGSLRQVCRLRLATARGICFILGMRLWTLHPKYLDARGLVALWREALLAQKVLRGKTKGYRHHPQLARFRAHPKPVAVIAAYLRSVHEEAARRGYEFDGSKIARQRGAGAIQLEETDGQLLYEWKHLMRKLRRRAPTVLAAHKGISEPEPHPLFRVVPGSCRDWEIVKPALSAKRPTSKASARRLRTSLRRKSAK